MPNYDDGYTDPTTAAGRRERDRIQDMRIEQAIKDGAPHLDASHGPPTLDEIEARARGGPWFWDAEGDER